MKFVLSDRIELLRRLNSERSRDLGPWEFEPAKNSGYITTIFGRYKSGEPAGLAYTVSGDADQQNVDAEFICAMTNAADDLFAERAAMMSRIGKYREALGAIELALDEFADEGTPGYQPLSDGSEYTCKFCEERWDAEDEIPPALDLKAVQSEKDSAR